jgi:hypothetical protein
MQDQIAAILGETRITNKNEQSPATTTALVVTSSQQHCHQNHIHNENEHYGDDECMSTASTTTTSSSTSMAEIDALLDGLVDAVHVQLDQEKFLDTRIREQVQLAAATMQRIRQGGEVVDQELGVILSMNLVHRMQMARQRVNLAIQLLQGHRESIESQLECHQQQQQQQQHDHYGDGDMLMNEEDEDVCIDISAQRNYTEQVQAILSAPLS